MATFDWGKVHGVEFSIEEAREASDFEEVLFNFGFDADRAFNDLGLSEFHNLPVGKRLFLAEKVSVDNMTVMILVDPDPRIRKVIENRLEEYRLEESGGVVTAR